MALHPRSGASPVELSKQDIIVVAIRNAGVTTIHNPAIIVRCDAAKIATFDPRGDTEKLNIEFQDGNAIAIGAMLHPSLKREEQFIFFPSDPHRKSNIQVTLFARDLIPLTASIEYSLVAQNLGQKHTFSLI